MHKKALENGDIKKLVPVKAGEVIRLRHVSTRRCLHSHDKRAPVTTKDYHNEVSGYGDDEFQGDDNDDWIVRIIEGNKNVPDSTKRLMSIHSKFRLIHRNQRCALYSNRVKLPKWAFEQTEVTCMKNAKVPRTLWRIESASHPSMPQDAPIAKYETPGFLAKLIEAHKVMLRVNNGLTSSHFYESRPHTWPWMRRGIGYWSTKTNAVYLLGNPIVWLLSLASVALFAVVQAVLALRDKRGYRDQLGGVRNVYFSAGGFFAISWALHYFPFFIMKRQLFIHHYLPALWFSILLFIFTVDLSTRRLKAGHKNIVYIVLTLLIFNAFYRLSPLSYGSSSWSESSCKRSKYFSSWDYDCSKYRPQPPIPPPSPRPQQKQQDAPPIPAAEDPAVHLNNDQVKPVDNLDAELSLNKIAPKLNSDEQLKIEQEKLMFKDEYKDKDKKNASESSSSGADSAVAAAPVSASSNDADDAPHD
ncbi:Dolichyl-phosphate-mannose-protein mannosyltransferase 1 [Zancudomyces culisetae]|uniref:Dolichyl-phosphate-mannose--protein mannosyltransferase n=1 Tax=Zancudomyces culisetae TaxID=1213189 RepID=A0A1R1PIC1_ZANCU|nr:Dolichyl-phosphate-mannose-protein mannosyltransferase 1 [Zancudomyces culisetae]|eukprot:OMH80755.1 Dolichyl-phosphate-mannose-protein mannosyltransferase 1 [Zancudomyces culisetae]